MPTILHLDSSPRGDYSISRKLSAAAVDAWRNKNADGKVIVRDLPKTEMTFVDLDWIMGAYTPPEQHHEGHKRALAISDELIAELLEADLLVLGCPMYNFAVPAVLKAWIDHVVRAGKTFQYTPDGPKGLARGKKAVVIVASAGKYDTGSPSASFDAEVPYLRQVLGFIGITDIVFVQAGGTAPVDQGKADRTTFLDPLLSQAIAAIE